MSDGRRTSDKMIEEIKTGEGDEFSSLAVRTMRQTISMLARTAGEKTQRPFQFSVLQRSTIQ